MEEQLVQSFMSLGAVGVIAGVLFKKFLEDSKTDKEYFRNELKESREVYLNELRKDREMFTNSIDRLTIRIDSVEDTVKDIMKDVKDSLNRGE